MFIKYIVGILTKGRPSNTGWQAFSKTLQLDIVFSRRKNVIRRQLASEKSYYSCFNFTGKVSYRGKDIELMDKYSCFDGAYDFYVDTITSYILVLTGLISMVEYNRHFVNKLILELEHHLNLLFEY